MALANLHLKPPDNFDFKQPDNWPKWKKRFEQFRVASGLANEEEPRQVSTLLYCLGEEADDVLTSTNIKDDDRKKYDAVIAKFDAFFQVRKNVIFERAKFNRRNQKEGESVEQYITALYSLVESCEYGALKEEMLRDRIVVGIRDTRLSERMQLTADLTLESAKKQVRQKEAVSEQGQQLRGDGSKNAPIVIEQVKGETSSKKPQSKRRGTGRSLSTRREAALVVLQQSQHVHAVASKNTREESGVLLEMPYAISATARDTTAINASQRLLQLLQMSST